MKLVPLSVRDCAVLAAACATCRPKAPKLYLERVVLLAGAAARATDGESFDAEAIHAEQRRGYFASLTVREGGAMPLAVVEARLNFTFFREAWEAVRDPTFEEHTAFEKIAEVLAET